MTLRELSNYLPITWCNVTQYLNLYLDASFSCCLWDVLRFFSVFCCHRPNLPVILAGSEQTIKKNDKLSHCNVLNPWHKNVRSPGSCVRVQIIQTDCHVSTRTSTHTRVHKGWKPKICGSQTLHLEQTWRPIQQNRSPRKYPHLPYCFTSKTTERERHLHTFKGKDKHTLSIIWFVLFLMIYS